MKRVALAAVAALTLGACVPSEVVVLTSGGIGVGSTGTVITTGTTTVVSTPLTDCENIGYSKTGEYCAD